MAVHDALHGGQADARAGKFALVMEALECPEQATGVSGIESGAIIAHEIGRCSVASGFSEFDARRLPLGGEFTGVAKQVFQDDAQEMGVAGGFETLLDLNLGIALGMSAGQLGDNGFSHSTQVDALMAHFDARDAGEIQEIVDEHTHALGCGAYAIEIFLAVRIQLVGTILQKRDTEAIYAAQRSSQIMGDRIAKRFAFLACRGTFEFGAAATPPPALPFPPPTPPPFLPSL